MSDAAMREALSLLARGEPIGRDRITAAMRELIAGACDPAQIGALLMGLAARREHIDEIVGAAIAMREASIPVPSTRVDLLDTCGTGGSGIARRNVSTAVAIAVSACGVAVAKHGNRAASSTSGSADVLELLGVDLGAPPETVGASIDAHGIGFCFAPALHPAMKHAAGVRRALGFRTLFNLLGPLCNPARATRQLLGVYDPSRCRDLAAALGQLGSTRVLVVHGFLAGVSAEDGARAGIDDLSCEGETLVWQWHRGELSRRVLRPADAELPEVPIADLAGEDPLRNAEALLRVLDGDPGPYRTAVQYGGALALVAAGEGDFADLPAHARRIAAVLDDGSARSRLADLVAKSHDRPRADP
ncbi:MAG TPA: anthranilate phosphoribosyltransferase [Nannocystaceae bacterium]|nr:anthranilate phosphoribosyltransferase [Nannocystaceae bacterium]